MTSPMCELRNPGDIALRNPSTATVGHASSEAGAAGAPASAADLASAGSS